MGGHDARPRCHLVGPRRLGRPSQEQHSKKRRGCLRGRPGAASVVDASACAMSTSAGSRGMRTPLCSITLNAAASSAPAPASHGSLRRSAHLIPRSLALLERGPRAASSERNAGPRRAPPGLPTARQGKLTEARGSYEFDTWHRGCSAETGVHALPRCRAGVLGPTHVAGSRGHGTAAVVRCEPGLTERARWLPPLGSISRAALPPSRA